MSSNHHIEADFRRGIVRDLRAAHRASDDREKQKGLLLKRKGEVIAEQKPWIDEHQFLLNEYCRNDLPLNYVPQNLRLVPCTERWQHDLWRLIKLTHWSMPPNEYVGRRQRILVFDGNYLLGLIGLASCIWGLTPRDRWIGWDVTQKTERLAYVVDAYVLGAIPPYNGDYRGSKLLAYIAASDEVREIWRKKYGFSPATIVTTTLFGHSAVLNRVKHEEESIWHSLGYTRGLGTMHFSLQTTLLAKELLARNHIQVPDRLQHGPNWKLRLMRTAIEFVGLKAEHYLSHGYKRGIYLMEYAENTKEFLTGNAQRLKLRHYKMDGLVKSWLQYAHADWQA